MSVCRARLWDAMNHAGLEHVAHVDTDSLLIDKAGLARMQLAYGDDFARLWQIKGTYKRLEIWGPRCYFRDGSRVTAGVPVKAKAVTQEVYRGERWTAVAGDLEASRGEVVTTREAEWVLTRGDPRRQDAPGAGTATIAYTVAGSSSSNVTPTPVSGTGL